MPGLVVGAPHILRQRGQTRPQVVGISPKTDAAHHPGQHKQELCKGVFEDALDHPVYEHQARDGQENVYRLRLCEQIGHLSR